MKKTTWALAVCLIIKTVHKTSKHHMPCGPQHAVQICASSLLYAMKQLTQTSRNQILH